MQPNSEEHKTKKLIPIYSPRRVVLAFLIRLTVHLGILICTYYLQHTTTSDNDDVERYQCHQPGHHRI